jgi:hypothetical protein
VAVIPHLVLSQQSEVVAVVDHSHCLLPAVPADLAAVAVIMLVVPEHLVKVLPVAAAHYIQPVVAVVLAAQVRGQEIRQLTAATAVQVLLLL